MNYQNLHNLQVLIIVGLYFFYEKILPDIPSIIWHLSCQKFVRFQWLAAIPLAIT